HRYGAGQPPRDTTWDDVLFEHERWQPTRKCGPHRRCTRGAAQADDRGNLLFFKKPARSPVAGDVVGHKSHGVEDALWRWLRGYAREFEACRTNHVPVERSGAADECDYGVRNPLDKMRGDRQARVQMPRCATTCEHDVWRTGHGDQTRRQGDVEKRSNRKW